MTKKKRIIGMVIGLVLLILLGFAFYFYDCEKRYNACMDKKNGINIICSPCTRDIERLNANFIE